MRKIVDFLLNSGNIFEEINPIEQHIFQHLYIDYKYNHRFTEHFVNEDRTSYNRLKSIVNQIASKIIDNLWKMHKNNAMHPIIIEFSYKDFNDIDNVFFENITVNVDFGEYNDSYYNHNNVKISQKTYFIDNINIYLTIKGNDWLNTNIVATKLMHEMTHAYDDYYSLIMNDKLFDFSEMVLKNAKLKINPKVKEEDYLKDILYFTMEIEQHAFENELIAELDSHKIDVKTPKEALEIIKNTNIYIAYQNLLIKLVQYKKNDLTNSSINIITNKFNEIFHKNYDSEKVFNILYKKINDSIERFEKIIGDICLEHLSKSCRFETSDFMINEALRKYKN